MNFEDQSHINKIRDALWESPNSNASVMVGSGFSRNAVPTQSKTGDLPTWAEVSSQLYGALYPHSANPQNVGGPFPGPDGMLRTAQEYQAAFGKTALHVTLRRLVQDEEYNSGTIHKRLLRLPWRDIYTTNWDTLLERTIPSVPERPYSVIRNMGEIPMASQPRIVKLHGTFGSQYPLIVTEEDYRIYPKKYAPFVNTVQQAMMETVFCLIGFSGDDPNFLSWSGWVRDNLGESAPKIYLAGFLDLSPHRHRMLEERNVVPIDLAKHPKAYRWPPDLKHTLATEWLLHTFERGRPYDVSNWPLRPTSQVNEIPEPIRELILPVDELTATDPMDEPSPSQISDEVRAGRQPADVVRENIAIWKHNRNIYPGWLFAPNSIRLTLSPPTEELERQILAGFQDLTAVERLNSLRELVWRKTILLDPINRPLESAIEETLTSIDCPKRTIDGEGAPQVDWIQVRQAWRTIAMEMVTAARYRWDRHEFEQRVDNLLEFVGEDQDIRHGIIHERCLWALYNFNFQDLDQLLSAWQTEDCDPVWMMRKSALHSEAGHPTEAQALHERALAAIRAVPVNTRSIGMQSREGWALLGTNSQVARQDTVNRLNELALLKCDSRQEIRAMETDLRPNRNEEEPPGFGIGLLQTFQMRWTNYQPKLMAYRATRFSELAGLPPHLHTSFATRILSANILKSAAEEVAGQDLEMAIRLILRCCMDDSDATLRKVVSLPRVATLTPQQAEFFARCCERVIETSMSHVPAGNGQQGNAFWTEHMEVAMEVLARLVIRLEPDRAEAILNLALECYRNPHLARHVWFAAPINNLLEFSWKSLPKERRAPRIFDLLSAPIAGLDGLLEVTNSEYPEPGSLLLESGDFPPRTSENEGLWQKSVQLVIRGLNSGSNPRRRASLRAKSLVESKRVTKNESQLLAEALWNQTNTSTDDLPRNTLLADLEFFYLPEPTSGMAEERFRKKWLSPQTSQMESVQGEEDSNVITVTFGTDFSALNEQTTDFNTILWQVGLAIRTARLRECPLDLSDKESQYLATVIEMWVDTPLPTPQGISIFDRERSRPLVQALEGLPSLVEVISLPATVAEKLLTKSQALNRQQIPAQSLAASLVGALPESFDEIVTSLRIGLTSSEIEMVLDAAKSLVRWLERSEGSESRIPAPPEDLVREIGIAIVSRRIPGLVGALRAAEWIFDKGTTQQQETISDLVQDGMNFLAVELNYEQERYDQRYIPLLRVLCARLAVAMVKAGLRDQQAVTTWLSLAYEDPLPEIREAVSVSFDSKS